MSKEEEHLKASLVRVIFACYLRTILDALSVTTEFDISDNKVNIKLVIGELDIEFCISYAQSDVNLAFEMPEIMQDMCEVLQKKFVVEFPLIPIRYPNTKISEVLL